MSDIVVEIKQRECMARMGGRRPPRPYGAERNNNSDAELKVRFSKDSRKLLADSLDKIVSKVHGARPWGGLTVPALYRTADLPNREGLSLRPWGGTMLDHRNRDRANLSFLRAASFKNTMTLPLETQQKSFADIKKYLFTVSKGISLLIKRDVEVDVQTTLSKADQFKWVVGIELEGGWTHSRFRRLVPRGKGDGSVSVRPYERGCDEDCTRENRCDNCTGEDARNSIDWSIGEVAGPIFSARTPEWKAWLKANHPDATNQSCGMHVHMGFFPARSSITELRESVLSGNSIRDFMSFPAYRRLQTPAVAHYIVRKLREEADEKGWLLLQKRLSTQANQFNEYCRPNPRNNPASRDARYYAINYSAYDSHGSIEFRMLPMGRSPERSIEYIDTLLSVVGRTLNGVGNYKITAEYKIK